MVWADRASLQHARRATATAARCCPSEAAVDAAQQHGGAARLGTTTWRRLGTRQPPRRPIVHGAHTPPGTPGGGARGLVDHYTRIAKARRRRALRQPRPPPSDGRGGGGGSRGGVRRPGGPLQPMPRWPARPPGPGARASGWLDVGGGADAAEQLTAEPQAWQWTNAGMEPTCPRSACTCATPPLVKNAIQAQ